LSFITSLRLIGKADLIIAKAITLLKRGGSMVTLIVSYKPLGDLVLKKIAKHINLAKAVDYFKVAERFKESKDVVEVARKLKADAAVVVANFKLACELLANGCKVVAVVMPKITDRVEIVKADVYILIGELKFEKL